MATLSLPSLVESLIEVYSSVAVACDTIDDASGVGVTHCRHHNWYRPRCVLGVALPGLHVFGRLVARHVILAQRAIPSYGPLWLHHYHHNPPLESRAEAACVPFSKAVVQIFGRFAVMPNGSHFMI